LADRNPIEVRLDRLHRQWDGFASDGEARLLRWLFAPDEWRMFEALLAIEDHREGELPVLFLVLSSPFEAAGRHGHELRRELAELASAGAGEFEQTGLAVWRTPISEGTSSDIGMFTDSLASLARHLADRLERLAIVLWPAKVLDAPAYNAWLRRLVRVVPDRVRVITPDRAEAPQLDVLVEQAEARVQSVRADLDMAGAAEELAAAAPGGDEPGGRYRAAFVGMGAAFGRGQLARAREQAEQARAIAEASAGFGHLEVALAFAFASGLLGAGEHAEAIAEFGRAEQRAAIAEQSGEAWAGGLRLRAAMGQGSALVAARAWTEAAPRWISAAGLARNEDDGPAELDCLRMAAWSHEQASRFDEAWAVGQTGLDRAAELSERARNASTLPWLGELMLRLSESGRRAEERGPIVRQLGELLGSNWRARLKLG
jgi:tetratricopeptide (TPR) repeat protein